MRRTYLRGHALRSEGKPYVLGQPYDRDPWVRPWGYQSGGVALCECGWTSPELESDGQRKRAHSAHKDEIRKATADA